jgi:hypothetical protein
MAQMKPGSWKQVLESRQTFLICALLACVTAMVYWSVGTFDFVNYDDDVFVYQNAVVSNGLTWSGIGGL